MTPEEKYKIAHAKIKNDTELNNIWEIFLADRHKQDNTDIEVFWWLEKKAKEKYCILRAKQYAGLISVKEYLQRREEAILYYEDRLVELEIAAGKSPKKMTDEILWKVLKTERQDFPLNKIPYVNFARHIPSLRLMLESRDYFHKNYVSTLKNPKLRFENKIHSKEKPAYEALDYLIVPLTKTEITNFEKERDV